MREALDEPAVVVGGDTAVVHAGRVLGKPADPAEAAAMISSLGGGSHEVLSGLAVATGSALASGVSRTEVRFRPVSDAEAEAYAATGEPLDKAGAYGIQGLGAALVDSIEGDYYTVVGFPVPLFVRLLARVGRHYDFGRIERLAD